MKKAGVHAVGGLIALLCFTVGTTAYSVFAGPNDLLAPRFVALLWVIAGMSAVASFFISRGRCIVALFCFAAVICAGSMFVWRGREERALQAEDGGLTRYQRVVANTRRYENWYRLHAKLIFERDINRARRFAAGRFLPPFDPTSENVSRPVMGPDGNRSSFALDDCTSLLGDAQRWADDLLEQSRSAYSSFDSIEPTDEPDEDAINLRVASFRLAARSEETSEGPQLTRYFFHYVLSVRNGAGVQFRPFGDVVLQAK